MFWTVARKAAVFGLELSALVAFVVAGFTVSLFLGLVFLAVALAGAGAAIADGSR